MANSMELYMKTIKLHYAFLLPCCFWLVMKFPTFYETWRFISVHRSQPAMTIMNYTNPVHTLKPYLLNTDFNTGILTKRC
jgi:hypothetical protein